MRFSLLLPLLAAACAPASAPSPMAAAPDGLARVRTLFVILPGDAGTPADPLVASLTRDDPAARAIALPRDAGQRTGDSYTADHIATIEGAVSTLRRRAPQARVVLVGEDGGAAIAADLAAIRPGIADGLVLVACPCALPEWRAHMAKRLPGKGWEAPVQSLDPLKTAGGIPTETRVAILVGADDAVYAPRFSRPYAEALALRGVAVDYRILPGRSANLLADPEVVSAATRLAAALPPRSS